MTNAQALKNVAEMTTAVAGRQEDAIKKFAQVKADVAAGKISQATAEAQTIQLAQIKDRAEQEMDSLLKVAASLIAQMMISEGLAEAVT